MLERQGNTKKKGPASDSEKTKRLLETEILGCYETVEREVYSAKGTGNLYSSFLDRLDQPLSLLVNRPEFHNFQPSRTHQPSPLDNHKLAFALRSRPKFTRPWVPRRNLAYLNLSPLNPRK
jgi:hypothetical protein